MNEWTESATNPVVGKKLIIITSSASGYNAYFDGIYYISSNKKFKPSEVAFWKYAENPNETFEKAIRKRCRMCGR